MYDEIGQLAGAMWHALNTRRANYRSPSSRRK